MRRARRATRAAAALAAAGALCALALPATAYRDDVTLVSAGPAGVAADGPSSEPSASADGRRVAFRSLAGNLSPADGPSADVFVRDLAAGVTTLVSRAGGASGAGGDDASGAPAISADGRRVAFHSLARNLSSADGDPYYDVFVRDLDTGVTTLVSRADGPAGAGGDGSSFAPAISADGRHVAFESLASNLVEGDGPGYDVFVRDLATGSTTLVSRADGVAGAPGDGASTSAAISADGRRVAFASTAPNLGGPVSQVLVRDLDAGTTTLASRADGPGGAPAAAPALAPAVSGDGGRVAFESAADGLAAGDAPGTSDVFVRDLGAGATILASRGPGAAGAAGDGVSGAPALSADGRRVAFSSSSTTFSDADADAHADVFLRDLAGGATVLVSRAPGPAGGPADAGSREPAVTADGALVAFATEADAVAPGGDPLVTNVVLRDVLGAPAPPSPAPPAPAPVPVPAAPAPAPPATPAATVRCAGVPATIVGTPGRDVIRGTPRRDVIAALGGDDVVRGMGGDDLICLGRGRDRAVGGRGSDSLLGGPGADRLDGGPGRDLLDGGSGGDRLAGGAGPDRLVGGAGRDRLIGAGGRDLAIGGPGRDVCVAERRAGCEWPRRRR